MSTPKEPRSFYGTRWVRAGDLLPQDVARINGQWRFLYDVNGDAPLKDGRWGTADEYRDEHDMSESMVIIRHEMDEKSHAGENEDAIAIRRYYDLMEIQVPQERER